MTPKGVKIIFASLQRSEIFVEKIKPTTISTPIGVQYFFLFRFLITKLNQNIKCTFLN